MQVPKFLKPGDLIEILAPAKAIESHYVEYAKDFLIESGFAVRISDHCLGQVNYFSGTLEERKTDFQNAMNDIEVNAILCARGGYGCVQYSDDLDWSAFEKSPKWIVGFSDVTVFHQKLQKMGFASIHGSMPLNFEENSEEALSTLVSALSGTLQSMQVPSDSNNQLGKVRSHILGGNLCILSSLIGTNDQPNFNNAILFVEEIDEPLYAIDRMFFSLKKAGILETLGGLIVGGMTSIKDSAIPYGSSFKEIILSHVSELNIPVCFNFPAGHIDDNRAIIFGTTCDFEVTESAATITYLGER